MKKIVVYCSKKSSEKFNSLEICDEIKLNCPENGMHPKECVDFTSDIVKELSESTDINATIHVFTHSPYILEGLEVFGEMYKIPLQLFLDDVEILEIAPMFKSFADAFEFLERVPFLESDNMRCVDFVR